MGIKTNKMEYIKKIKFGKISHMMAISEDNEMIIWDDGEIGFQNNDGVKWKEHGFEDATRKEFNDWFISNKIKMDNFIKEL